MGYNVCSKDHNGTKWQAGQKAQGCISLTLNSTKKLLSVSLSALSASSLLLLNMHASNILHNQAWAFVFGLCRVAHYAMIESQNSREILSAQNSKFRFLWVLKRFFFLKAEFHLNESSQSSLKSNHRQSLLNHCHLSPHYKYNNVSHQTSPLDNKHSITDYLHTVSSAAYVFSYCQSLKKQANWLFLWPTSSTSGGTQNLSVTDKLSLCRPQKQ